MEWTKGAYRLSDDKTELDLYYIVPALQQTYWASGRPKDVIEKSIENSLCFGLYKDDRQVGFARVVTDACTFAWVCDVIVHPDHRSIGLGKWMMACLDEHPDVGAVPQQLLRTKDAHGLYEQFGYTICDAMVRRPGGEPDKF